MTVRLAFPIPCDDRGNEVPPWSTNKTLHWSKRSRYVRAWRQAALDVARERAPRSRSALGPAIIQVTIPFKVGRDRDPMNYVGTCVKAIVDGLVDGGMWPKDTAEYVTIEEPELVLAVAHKPLVVVTIRPREQA